jgi:hypothetical protein
MQAGEAALCCSQCSPTRPPQEVCSPSPAPSHVSGSSLHTRPPPACAHDMRPNARTRRLQATRTGYEHSGGAAGRAVPLQHVPQVLVLAVPLAGAAAGAACGVAQVRLLPVRAAAEVRQACGARAKAGVGAGAAGCSERRWLWPGPRGSAAHRGNQRGQLGGCLSAGGVRGAGLHHQAPPGWSRLRAAETACEAALPHSTRMSKPTGIGCSPGSSLLRVAGSPLAAALTGHMMARGCSTPGCDCQRKGLTAKTDALLAGILLTAGAGAGAGAGGIKADQPGAVAGGTASLQPGRLGRRQLPCRHAVKLLAAGARRTGPKPASSQQPAASRQPPPAAASRQPPAASRQQRAPPHRPPSAGRMNLNLVGALDGQARSSKACTILCRCRWSAACTTLIASSPPCCSASSSSSPPAASSSSAPPSSRISCERARSGHSRALERLGRLLGADRVRKAACRRPAPPPHPGRLGRW